MKKITAISCILLTLALFPLFAGTADTVTISRVRVYLDDAELTEETEAPSLSLSTILSYTSLRAGKEMTLEQLDAEVEQTQLRLLSSGLVYAATVEIVPPRKNPERRTVIISVTTGFLNRYGGGGFYGLFGKVAVGGRRNQLMVAAGLNLNGISYTDENFLGLPVLVGASAFTDAPYSLLTGNGAGFSGTGTAGVFLTPDIRLCADIQMGADTRNGFRAESFILSPYVRMQHFVSGRLFLDGELRLYQKPCITWDGLSGEICGSASYSPFQKLNIGLFGSFGTGAIAAEADAGHFAHDLSAEHQASELSSRFQSRSVRSGYTASELTFGTYALVSAEARWTAAEFVIANIFPCAVRPFVFADLAAGKQAPALGGTVSQNAGWRFVDAYGAGVQVYLDCPVFACFNFAGGINHEGNAKYCFYMGLRF